MELISMSEWKRLDKTEALAHLPCQISIEGVPTLIVDRLDNIITLSDLHPRVQIQLKALERKARVGMPPVKKIDSADVRAPILEG